MGNKQIIQAHSVVGADPTWITKVDGSIATCRSLYKKCTSAVFENLLKNGALVLSRDVSPRVGTLEWPSGQVEQFSMQMVSMQSTSIHQQL